MLKKIKLRWAKKIMQARYFVVLTDAESVIALDGVDPDKFEDLLALNAQTASLTDFTDRLKDLVKRHNKAVDKLLHEQVSVGSTNAKKKKSTNSRKTKSANKA